MNECKWKCKEVVFMRIWKTENKDTLLKEVEMKVFSDALTKCQVWGIKAMYDR